MALVYELAEKQYLKNHDKVVWCVMIYVHYHNSAQSQIVKIGPYKTCQEAHEVRDKILKTCPPCVEAVARLDTFPKLQYDTSYYTCTEYGEILEDGMGNVIKNWWEE